MVQTPMTTTMFTFQFCRDTRSPTACNGENVQTYTYTRRVYDPRRLRAYYERGDRDRAIARSTVTHAYIGPGAVPASDHLVLLSVYRDRVMAKPNPRFRIPSLALSGETLSDSSSFACLPAGRLGPIFVDYLTGPSPGPDLRSRDNRKIASEA